MPKKTTFGYSAEVSLDFAEAVEKATELLKDQGFGILTTIDVKAKMKEKLDKDMDDYVILGACNPTLASKALDTEIEIGLLLPCNVIIYVEQGKTYVSAIMPKSMMEMAGKKDLCEVAETAEVKLQSVINVISNL